MPDELAFCVELGLERGVDVDTETPQRAHICWPYAAYHGALCASPKLWGHQGPIWDGDQIDCWPCIVRLFHLRAGDPLLLGVIARLTEAVRTLDAIQYGPPEERHAAIAADHERHVRNMDAYKRRVGS